MGRALALVAYPLKWLKLEAEPSLLDCLPLLAVYRNIATEKWPVWWNGGRMANVWERKGSPMSATQPWALSQ